jgi:PKD repeat protein
MKKTSTKYILIAALAVTFFAACKKKPIACIDSNFIERKVTQPIKFSSCSENADRLEWNMGDGTTFTYPVVDYTYETPGIYTITLTVFNDNDNNSDEVTREITITP